MPRHRISALLAIPRCFVALFSIGRIHLDNYFYIYCIWSLGIYDQHRSPGAVKLGQSSAQHLTQAVKRILCRSLRVFIVITLVVSKPSSSQILIFFKKSYQWYKSSTLFSWVLWASGMRQADQRCLALIIFF